MARRQSTVFPAKEIRSCETESVEGLVETVSENNISLLALAFSLLTALQALNDMNVL